MYVHRKYLCSSSLEERSVNPMRLAITAQHSPPEQGKAFTRLRLRFFECRSLHLFPKIEGPGPDKDHKLAALPGS